MKYINRTPELCEFMNTLQELANIADSGARNLMWHDEPRMRAAAARDAYLFAISFADRIFGDKND
jgi:hypothetical protein